MPHFLAVTAQFFYPCQPSRTTNLLLSLLIHLLLTFHVNGIIQHVLLYDWFPFAQNYVFKVHPCCTCVNLLFLSIDKYYIACIYLVLFIRSSVDGHLACFHFLNIFG